MGSPILWGDPDIGERYSVLSLSGWHPRRSSARRAYFLAELADGHACGADAPPAANPDSARRRHRRRRKAGRNKVTILTTGSQARRMARTIARGIDRQTRQGMIPVDLELPGVPDA